MKWLRAWMLALLASGGSLAQAATFIDANGVNLRYQLSGERGPVVVLIPEIGMGIEDWDDIVPGIQRGRRVLRYDPRGAGLSEKIRGTATYEQHVDDLLALLDALSLREPVVLVGSAMGGAIALRLAADHPRRVRALVASSPATGTASAAARQGMIDSADRLEQIGVRAWVDFQQPDVYPAQIVKDPARLARWRSLQLANDAASWAANVRMVASADFSGVFQRVRCPALVIAVARYPARPPALVKQLAEQIPGARFEVLDTGHFVPVQAPELLLPVLKRFLAEHGA